MENIPKKIWQSKVLCFTCDLSNRQQYSFKECPLTLGGSFDCDFTHISIVTKGWKMDIGKKEWSTTMMKKLPWFKNQKGVGQQEGNMCCHS